MLRSWHFQLWSFRKRSGFQYYLDYARKLDILFDLFEICCDENIQSFVVTHLSNVNTVGFVVNV